MSRKKVLSKFTILCWATFIALLGRVRGVLTERVGRPNRGAGWGVVVLISVHRTGAVVSLLAPCRQTAVPTQKTWWDDERWEGTA